MNIFIIILFLGTLNAEKIIRKTWEGDLENFRDWDKNIRYGSDSIELVSDPKSKEMVLKINYAKGTYAGSKSKKGAGIYVYPFGRKTTLLEATLEYQILFASNFQWVRGGKLPGMFGGRESCTGHDPAHDCYSARLMWRKNGEGHPYLYIANNAPHEKEFCSHTQYLDCKRSAGFNFNRSHYFTQDQWIKVKEYIKLNSKPDKPDGVLKLWINGAERVNYNKIIWRRSNKIFTLGFQIESFFGGNDATWATTTNTFTLYKGFKFSNNFF